jgi:uncharacterized protein YqcC (DUF446 family)
VDREPSSSRHLDQIAFNKRIAQHIFWSGDQRSKHSFYHESDRVIMSYINFFCWGQEIIIPRMAH